MLKLEEKIVLDIMASEPRRRWSSAELKRAVLARLPDLGERTVRRVFVRLEAQSLIRRAGEGRNTTWALLATGPREAVRPPIDVSLALLKLRQLGKHHLPPGAVGDLPAYMEGAERVLCAGSPDSRARDAQMWIGQTARIDSGYSVLAPTCEEAVFDAVCAALYRDETLHVECRSTEGAAGGARGYVVLPYAVVMKPPFWYLVVRMRRSSGAQGDPFLLRMDRVVLVESRGFDMKRDAGFDLDSFIHDEKMFEWFPEAPERCVLRVTEEDGRPSPFRAARLSHDQTITEQPGGFVLEATMTPSLALRNLLLEHVRTVELVAPARIRREIAQDLATASGRYSTLLS